ncbi:MAG TPA: cytochrome c, partial [Terriglobales bacterium]|nr:cytochrome c [Terriglobales bacterium]
GDAFKTASDELKRSAPDVAKLRVSSATIAALAPKVESWFPPGSGPQDGVQSDALETVWTDRGEFRRAAQRFTAAATNFDALAKAGDVAATRDATKALGGACKACHDRFREKD